MNLQNLKGKIVIRTKAYSSGDRSYMTAPILIEKITNDVVYYRHDSKSKISILGCDWNDEHWTEVDEIYIKDHWPEHLDHNQLPF